ncbi:MAG: pyruvate kinase [Acidobacteriota bacterium]
MGKDPAESKKKSSATKIVCTMGPASETGETIKKLILNGMSVARINFSHGDHATHKKVIGIIRKESEALDKPVAILGDLSGPKIRMGILKEPVPLKKGQDITISVKKGEDAGLFSDFSKLPSLVKKGDRILIDDGLIELRVLETKKSLIKCRVKVSGIVKSRKGINLPDTEISFPVFTEKDRKDLLFGIGQNIDLIAMSFVDSPSNIIPVKKILKKFSKQIPVIAKIERPQALKKIDDIINAFDGIMIARGDLGVEVNPEEVPLIQKTLLIKAGRHNRMVITATQMLESMISNPRPTRAEASDVSNAILGGSDAVMLSGETAVGEYPVNTVNMMRKIAVSTENSEFYNYALEKEDYTLDPTEAIVKGAAEMAFDLNVKSIMLFSFSGSTALLLSKYRPPCPVYAFTPNRDVLNRMSGYWGVFPQLLDFSSQTDEMIIKGEKVLLKKGCVKKGDLLLTVAGETPMKGATNMLKLLKVP